MSPKMKPSIGSLHTLLGVKKSPAKKKNRKINHPAMSKLMGM